MGAKPPSSASWGRALDLGLQFAFSIVVGMALGYYLDRWLETGPVFLFVFLGFGFAAGVRALFRFARLSASDGTAEQDESDSDGSA